MIIWIVTFSLHLPGQHSCEILVNFATHSFEELIPAIDLHAKELAVMHIEPTAHRPGGKVVVAKIERGGFVHVIETT